MTTTHGRWDNVRAAFWTLVGASVAVLVFFAALGGIAPAQAKVASVIVLVLGLAWFAHSWTRFTSHDTTHISRADRERRGF